MSLQVKLQRLTAQCAVTAAACAACVDASMASGLADTFRLCVQTAQDCQEICHTTVQVAERYEGKPKVLLDLVRACAKASAAAATACEAHAETIYRSCTQACRECEQACTEVIAALRWR